MQVVVIPIIAPRSSLTWSVSGGFGDEPQGKAGIAHFLEHLMFKGTNKYPPGAFNRIIRQNGGEDNASLPRITLPFSSASPRIA